MIWPKMTNFKLVQDFILANILTKFHEYQTENVTSWRYTRFFMIWPSDLVFDPTLPIFTLILDFIKAIILTKFHVYQTENVASKVYTR